MSSRRAQKQARKQQRLNQQPRSNQARPQPSEGADELSLPTPAAASPVQDKPNTPTGPRSFEALAEADQRVLAAIERSQKILDTQLTLVEEKLRTIPNYELNKSERSLVREVTRMAMFRMRVEQQAAKRLERREEVERAERERIEEEAWSSSAKASQAGDASEALPFKGAENDEFFLRYQAITDKYDAKYCELMASEELCTSGT